MYFIVLSMKYEFGFTANKLHYLAINWINFCYDCNAINDISEQIIHNK